MYKRFSFIICLKTVTKILITTFQLHTAGLHQAIVSTMVVCDWCITNLAHGWQVSIQIICICLSSLQMTNENKSVMAFNLSFLFDQRELLKESMAQLLGWVKEGQLKVTKVTKYPLKEAGKAHKDLESGQTVGKLVLTMDDFELKMSEGCEDKN